MKFLLLILLLIVSIPSFAQDCKSMNLITEKGSPFQKGLPVYDQDGIGICYAYAAAQLIDYQLIKNGGSRSVHPLWAALKYSQKRNEKKISSGITFRTIEDLIKEGNCHQSLVTKGISDWAQKANISEAELMSFIEKLAPKLSMHKLLNPFSSDSFYYSGSFESGVDKAIREAIAEQTPYCSPNTTWDKLIPELKELGFMSSTAILSSLVLSECKPPFKALPIGKPNRILNLSDQEWAKTLDKTLDSLHAPVSISYCSRVLSKADYAGIKRKTLFSSESLDKNCGSHESLLVGKKKIGNQCHYLLRNSWGSGWGSWTANRKCLCKNRKTGAYLDNCERSKHNNGQYIVEACWVNSNQLSKNTMGMTSLSKK